MSSREIFAALAKPFDRAETRSKVVRGQQLTYITSRSAMNRLDEVLGPENWAEEYEILEQRQQDRMHHAVARCRLTITIGDRSVTRIDVGGAGNPDPLVALKGAYSDALKRAAVKLGVGRHLYGDGIPDYDEAEIDEPHQHAIPTLPAEGLASGAAGQQPTTGKGLWGWCKKFEETGQPWAKGLTYRTVNHFKKQQYPEDLADWSPQHVAEACRYVDGLRLAPPAATEPKPVAKPRSPKPPMITYDEGGNRITPLMMSEQVTPSEIVDARSKVIDLAAMAGLSVYDFAAAICAAAGEDGKAPYLRGMKVSEDEAIRHYALLRKHFPEWLKPTVKALVNQAKANRQGSAA